MALIQKRILPSGSVSWRLQLRRKGVPKIDKHFSTKKEAENYLMEVGNRFNKHDISLSVDGRQRKRLTLEHRKLIKKYLDQNLTYQQIGEKIGFCKSVISYEIRRFESREHYDPERAHKDHLKRYYNIGDKEPKQNEETCQPQIQSLEEKIKLLEMQIEILAEQMEIILNRE